MSRQTVFLLAILVLGALLRFLWLDRVPHSINGDELHYILSAKSFALTGKDITQAVTPFDTLLFHYPPTEVAQAELPYFLEMITVGFFPFSMIGIALPGAMLSFLLIIIMYSLTKKLINEQTALVAAFMTAINPWFIAAGRTTYEMVSATFFYMAAFYIMVLAKGWKILWAFPVFVLAFYTYIATKLIFLPIVIVFSAYCYFAVHKKKYLKQYLTMIGLSVVFVGFFVFQLLTASSQSRASEIINPSYPIVAQKVNDLRKLTMESPLISLYENKITAFNGIIVNNIFEVFSLKYLFFNGDYFFSLGRHGLMYMLDPLFVVIGMGVLFVKRKKLFWLVIGMCVITVLPQIIHKSSIANGNFSPHTTMLIPFLILLIAPGVWETILAVKKQQKIIGVVIIGAYMLLVGNFFNIYFFQLPLQHNFYNLPNRLLSQYAEFASPHERIIIYTPDPRGKYQEYLFYTNNYNSHTTESVSKALENKKYTMGNVSFISCDRQVTEYDEKVTSVVHIDCGMSYTNDIRSIPDLSDSGAVYKIIHDKFCRPYGLKPYISGITINNLAIDSLSPQQFCSTFVMAR